MEAQKGSRMPYAETKDASAIGRDVPKNRKADVDEQVSTAARDHKNA